MKLITLNLWGGKVFDPLMRFLTTHAKDADIFCFQEMIFGPQAEFLPVSKARANLFSEIGARLSGFTALTYPAPQDAGYFENELLPPETQAGQAIFVRDPWQVIAQGGFRAYQEGYPPGTDFGGKITGSCQWAEIQAGKESMTVLSLHGIWQKGSDKIDTPARLTQSQIIQDFLAARTGKKILCGDFNLVPDGESIKLLQQGMKNLVTEFGVTSTRSALYTKPGKFADYILVSPEVTVEKFAVLPDVVSDHLPLLLKFH